MALFKGYLDEEKTINAILSQGISNVFSLKKNKKINYINQKKKKHLSCFNTSVNEIENQIEKFQKKVHGLEKRVNSIPKFLNLIQTNPLSNTSSNKRFNTIIQTDRCNDTMLKNIQPVLTSRSKDKYNQPILTSRSKEKYKRSKSTINFGKLTNKNHNEKILEHETNMLWKEKYEKMQAEYSQINCTLIKEEQNNKICLDTIECYQKKKEEICHLLKWHQKLIKINETLLSQYETADDNIKYQKELISKLNLQLHQLRNEFHYKRPIELMK